MTVCILVLVLDTSLVLKLATMTRSRSIHQTYLILGGQKYSYRLEVTTEN